MVAVQVAISLTALLGAVAIVADGGILLAERRHAQATADAAALAAATDLYTNYNTNGGVDSSGTAATSALTTASSNGYSNVLTSDGQGGYTPGSSSVTVRVPVATTPAATYFSGTDAGTRVPQGCAEVTVTYYQGRTFSNIFGSGSIPISTRAVARGRGLNLSILTLNSTGASSLSLTGGSSINAPGAVLVNSSDTATGALSVGSGSSLIASAIDVVGGKNIASGDTVSPTPATGVVISADTAAQSATVAFSGTQVTTPDPLASNTALPVPTLATATATVVNSTTVNFTITNAGTGYLTAPGVMLTGGNGTYTSVTASVNAAGQVTGITLNGAAGWSPPPTPAPIVKFTPQTPTSGGSPATNPNGKALTTVLTGTANGTSVTGLSSTSNLFIGEYVFGTRIPPGTTISAVNSSTTITLTQAATSSGPTTMTFACWNSTAGKLYDPDASGGLSFTPVTGWTIYPGQYVGLAIGSGTTVTMSPGIYYLTGNGNATFVVLAVAGTLQDDGSGTGVMIYNGGTGTPASVGKMSVTSTGKPSLTPFNFASGNALHVYNGISIFQDRGATAAMTLTGGNGTNIKGIVYAAAAPISASGTTGATVATSSTPGSAIICGSLTTGGTGTITLPPPSLRIPVYGPWQKVGILE
jgi:Flp pilus assembly protein TadG